MHTETPWVSTHEYRDNHTDQFKIRIAHVSTHRNGPELCSVIAGHNTQDAYALARANAKRITECVNGCEGLNPKHVKTAIELIPKLLNAIHANQTRSENFPDNFIEECHKIHFEATNGA